MWECEKCKGYRMSSVTTCHCKQFTVTNEDGEDIEFYAMDEDGAALKYAEYTNIEGDYHLMNETVDILVNGKAFRVGAEPDIYYSSEEL